MLILLDETFNSENGGNGQLNYSELANWDITNDGGLVDLLGPDQDYGMYLDLEGTSGVAASLQTKQEFNFNVGDQVTIKFELSNNGLSINQLTARLGVVFSKIYKSDELGLGIQNGDYFSPDNKTSISETFRVEQAFSGKLAFEHDQATAFDDSGLLIDNIQLLITRDEDTSPTYAINPSVTSINEGQLLSTTILTTNVGNGSTVYWKLSGLNIDSSDFSSGELLGSGQVNDNTFSFNHTLASDLRTEGNESVQIRLYSDSARTLQVGTTAAVTINDTSTTPAPTYTINPSVTSINEGQLLSTTILTTNVGNGSTVYWKLSGLNIDSSDFSSGELLGSGQVNNNTFSFNHILASDLRTEGNESVQITLYRDSARTQQVAQANLTINDTSRTPPSLAEITDYQSNDWQGKGFVKVQADGNGTRVVPGGVTFVSKYYNDSKKLVDHPWISGRPLVVYAHGWQDGPNTTEINSTSQRIMRALA